MISGEPTKVAREQDRKIVRKRSECQVGREVISTLINDSKLPLNNLTLKTERGLARRVPVWDLNGPLGCLEHKQCISKKTKCSSQSGLSQRC